MLKNPNKVFLLVIITIIERECCMKIDQKKNHSVNWLLLIGIMLIATNLRSPLTGISPLLSAISQELNLSLAISGMLTTIPLIAFAIFSLVAPYTERRFGIERVLFFAIILLAAGISIRSMGSQLTLFGGTLLIGIAIAHCNVLVPSLVKRDFSQQSGLVTGLYSVTMNVFGALASGLSLPLATKWGLGWEGALRIWLITCLLALIFWLPQLSKKTIVKVVPLATAKNSLFGSALAWKISLLMGIQSLIFYTIVTWLPQIVASKGLGIEKAGSMLAVLQIILVPVTFIVSVIAGRMKDQVLLAWVGTLTLLIGILSLWLSSNLVVSYLAMALLALGCGSCFSLAMMFFSLRTRDGAEASQLSGMAQALGYLLASFGPIVLGSLFDYSNSWNSSFILLTTLALIQIYVGTSASKEGFV